MKYRHILVLLPVLILLAAPGLAKKARETQNCRGVSCRETFVTDCRRGSRQVSCPDVLRAEGTLWVGNLQ